MVPYGVPWGRQKRQWQPCFYKPQGHINLKVTPLKVILQNSHDIALAFQLLLEVEARRSRRLEVSLGYGETLSQSKQGSKQTNSKEKEERKKAQVSTVRSVENVFLSMKGLPQASWNYSWVSGPWQWQSGPHISTSNIGKLSTSHSRLSEMRQHGIVLI